MDDETLFNLALDRPANERAAFLKEACGADAECCRRVEALIDAHENPQGFLGTPCLTPPTLPTDGLHPQATFDLSFLHASSRTDALGRLDHYEILEVVGSGGFGVVLKAFDEKLHRMVAIKVLAPELAASAMARKRFVREARAAAAVNHESIVAIHAVEEAGTVPYLVMEYIAGTSLEEQLRKAGPLEPKEILRIGLQTAQGLAAAHRHGLVHRDVKPANILLENGVQRVKLTDFGLARIVDDASVTQPGVIAGTPSYMSPEQARGEAVDHRSDLFSLGCVLYAMCAGRSPFRAETTIAAIRRVCDDNPRSVVEINSEIPLPLVAVIDRLLAKDPSSRFHSAEEVAGLLQQQLAGIGQASSLPAQRMADRKPAPRSRRWAIAVAALVLMGFVLTVTDATGVTGVGELVRTILRIQTPAGMLAIEVDDPGVQVTIEGDGGLSITGAGPQQVNLRPGSYRLQASKDGKPIPLEKELVSISRGDKQIVRVRLEGDAAPLPSTAAKTQRQAFVVRGGQAAYERKFDTLADAVIAASNGDTIEIHGNGPFVSQPINIGRTALTIRAGEGYRPVIKLSSEAARHKGPFLATQAALALEGLELHRALPDDLKNGGWTVVRTNGAPLWATNCRFRAPVFANLSPACTFRNCEFLSTDSVSVGGRFHSGAKFIFENCLHWTNTFPIGFESGDPALLDASIQIKRNTFASIGASLRSVLRTPLSGPSDPPKESNAFRIDVSETIFDTPFVLGFLQDREFLDRAAMLEPAQAEATLLGLVIWHGERNLFAPGSTSVRWTAALNELPPHGPKSLEEWKRFWGAAETNSLEGTIRFQGGNLHARPATNVDQLTPDDFRLRPDSPGYRAGPDGKDLGADIDLVGPGPAYERWKNTPEYQDWLKETKQLR